MADSVPDLPPISTGQCFPLYVYHPNEDQEPDLFTDADDDPYSISHGVSDFALQQFRSAYGDRSITKDDIFYYVYGVLHSPEYRERFEADLSKMLPRIPFAKDFWAFAKAGRELGDLHVGYVDAEPHEVFMDTQGLTCYSASGTAAGHPFWDVCRRALVHFFPRSVDRVERKGGRWKRQSKLHQAHQEGGRNQDERGPLGWGSNVSLTKCATGPALQGGEG